ncbi:MAG: DNA-directed RNA polymerase subunit D [Candidatus Woesearchaeota archaeon]
MSPKIELLEKKSEFIQKFLLTDATPAFANALRKVAIDEVPTLAIEDVEIVKNSSALYDEMLGLRLGLIPFTTDLKDYTPIDKCSCKGEGCAKCSVNFTLEAENTGYVYASSIKTKDSKVKPVFKDMPIAKLIKGQKIEVQGNLVMGRGKMHAKWSPGLVWYTYEPKIKIIDSKVKNPQEIAKICPEVFEVSSNKLKVKNVYAYKDVCENFEGIEVEFNPNNFIFYVESWGQLSPKEIITNALDILAEKSEELVESLKEK